MAPQRLFKFSPNKLIILDKTLNIKLETNICHKDEVEELIDDAISAATKVKNDPKKSENHKTTASSVSSKVKWTPSQGQFFL